MRRKQSFVAAVSLVGFLAAGAGFGVHVQRAAAERAEIDTPTIVADTSNADELATLASRASVVITTVGPYALYGEGVVDTVKPDASPLLQENGNVVGLI